MIIEHKPIEGVLINNQLFGRINLDQCAWVDKKKYGMTITVNGKRWFPIEYDVFGRPLFSKEQLYLVNYIEKEAQLRLEVTMRL